MLINYFQYAFYSRSTGKGVKYMREVLKHPFFIGSEATEEFIFLINDTYDLLNSRGTNPNKMKSSLGRYNKNLAYHTFEKVEDFIRGLKTEDGTYVINSKKRMGFVSVLFNILTVKKLYETLVIPEQLSYISTWYLNQDRKAFKMDYTRYQVEDNRYMYSTLL